MSNEWPKLTIQDNFRKKTLIFIHFWGKQKSWDNLEP
jgi:hypothetical protein